MRFWTTLLLLVLTAAGALTWFYWDGISPKIGLTQQPAAQSGSATALSQITKESLVRIELDDVRLERQGTSWSLSGNWPTRSAEVDELVNVLTNLNSRFASEPFHRPQTYGLAAAQRPVTIRVTVDIPDLGEKTYTLLFGELPAKSGNPFVRATYLHVDDQPEVLRLAPGLIDRLRKGRDDFLRRQLFSNVVRTKVGDASRPSFGGENELPAPAQPLLNAEEISVTSPEGAWTLKNLGSQPQLPIATGPPTVAPEKLASRWQLIAPVTDHVDPDKLKSVLASVPELWAETFVTETDPGKTGLDQPERTITVKSSNGELKVLIGKVSRVKEIKPPPAPPPTNPLAPPPPPQQPIREEYRYAKLPNHPQVFELRTDKFGELFIKPADLRDSRLARFRTSDVTKLEIVSADRKFVFAKEKDAATHEDRWQVLEPLTAPAEANKILELLDKLSDLQVRGDAVIDSTELKNYGLAVDSPVTTITLSVREEPGDGTDISKETKSRTITYRLGKNDLAKSKLYLQVTGVARIDAVPDDLLKLVDRPILAYRSRQVIDLQPAKLAKIEVSRPADSYALSQNDGKWRLAAPVSVPADDNKSSSLAGDLARLEAADIVNFHPTADDLKNYGLDASTLRVTLAPTTGTLKTIVFGKAREGKPEVYGKLLDAPEVFSLRQGIKDSVDQPSLAFRPLQLWNTAGVNVQSIKVEKPTGTFTVTRDGAYWKLSGPFDATAFLPAVQPLLEAAMAPRAERFEAHNNDDLTKFGLDKPATTLTATVQGENAAKVLQIGKPVVDGQPARFAKIADQPGVFVIGPSMADAISRSALDFLDRRLLSVDTRLINKVSSVGAQGSWSAKKDGDQWLLDSFHPPIVGDRGVIDLFLNAFSDVRASTFAAYNPTDLAQFGLDQPSSTVTVALATGDQPVTHAIALGKPSPDNSNLRFARIDNGPAIALLPANLSTALSKSPLDLVDRNMLSFSAKDLITIRRQMSNQELQLELKDGSWKMTKPQETVADDPAIFELAERLANLRAVKVAALNVTDVKPFGLETPSAIFTLTVKQPTGSPKELRLKLGGAGPDGQFAQTATDTVFVLADSPGDPLAKRLLADAVKFRDRSLVRFNDADRIVITRGNRTTTFAKVDGQWKMTSPIIADAEVFDLDDLVLAASRLRADELVADHADDLKSLGLDPPDSDLKFFLGDQQVAHLLVSKKGEDGRATIKSTAGTLVAKAEPGVSTRLLNEFRKRSLWTNLDVIQADSVIINSGAGGTPLMLIKTESSWQVPGRTDQSVKAETVSEFLSTLAGLKAERYVADDKADLKLYGLEPPVRVIVVKTRNGQTTTLHLGRMEGDSKRVYATVPGANWVVVLNDVDSSKLMKDTNEFTSK